MKTRPLGFTLKSDSKLLAGGRDAAELAAAPHIVLTKSSPIWKQPRVALTEFIKLTADSAVVLPQPVKDKNHMGLGWVCNYSSIDFCLFY